MAADPLHGGDPKIIRRILKEDIAARKLVLSAPGLTERERLRHEIYITNARIHRHYLNDPEFKPFA